MTGATDLPHAVVDSILCLDVDDMDLGQMLAEISRLHRGPLQGLYTQVDVAWRDGLFFEPGWYALRRSRNSYEHRSDRFSDPLAAAECLISQLRRDLRDEGEAM